LETHETLSFFLFKFQNVIQGVPLAIKPGISLIIFTTNEDIATKFEADLLHCVRNTSSFLTQRTYSCSNFVAISSMVLELLQKCRVR